MFLIRGSGRYRGKKITEAVMTHVDSLLGGKESVPQLLEQYPDESSSLEDLFRISDQLHQTLVPVKPREQFVSDLKAELQSSQAALLSESSEQRQLRVTRATNTVGVLLSIVAVTALITRLVGIVVVVVTFLSRRCRSTAPA
ncbi:MAG: hypothetical protein JXB30_13470 [Anaerolineae bacterium]|nr:hypothetical protein [Anaerolineae bacterium]